MSARDDYPCRERNVPMYAADRTLHEAMCDEIDDQRRRALRWFNIAKFYREKSGSGECFDTYGMLIGEADRSHPDPKR